MLAKQDHNHTSSILMLTTRTNSKDKGRITTALNNRYSWCYRAPAASHIFSSFPGPDFRVYIYKSLDEIVDTAFFVLVINTAITRSHDFSVPFRSQKQTVIYKPGLQLPRRTEVSCTSHRMPFTVGDRKPVYIAIVDGHTRLPGAFPNTNTATAVALLTAAHKDAQLKGYLKKDPKEDPKSESLGTAATNEADSGYEGDVAALQDIAFKLKANILKMQEGALELKQDAIAVQVEALEMKRECLRQWKGSLCRGHVFHANIALLTSIGHVIDCHRLPVVHTGVHTDHQKTV
ncbi:hypothetical protein GGR51DRAFT_567899 [Nemania sp. FL0031]|nr:hypothetical protein GGR51DRAFT_567899 [Nemania sp. FL0031]